MKFAMVILFTADFAAAPFAGAWIEIAVEDGVPGTKDDVAPFTGARIEMPTEIPTIALCTGRSLHGSVD